MESFVQIAAPLAIALLGFVLFWGVARLIINRKDGEGDKKNDPENDDKSDK